MKKILFVYAFLFVIAGSLSAQQNFTLYNMDFVPQRLNSNPSFIPSAKVNVGLPVISSVYANFSNSGFRYSHLVRKRSDDSLYLDFNNMLNKLKNNNFLSTSFTTDILSFGFKVKNNYFSFNCTERVESRFRYPKDFMNFLWRGNAPFLGKDMAFNFGLDYIHYREYAFGFAREWNDKLTVGGKVKYLYGMENIWTERSDVTLTTEPEFFAITAKSDIIVNTSGIDTSAGSFGEYSFGLKNRGLATDLGATYKLNEKISFSASVLDLGFIRWKSNVANFKSNNPGGAFTYEGLPLAYYFNNDSAKIDDAIDELLDTLEGTFAISKHHEAYTNWLSARTYLGGHYQLKENHKVSAVLYGQFFDGSLHPGFSLSYSLKVKKFLNVSANYSAFNRSWNNIGIGTSINAGPVQFYFITDNILAVFYPEHAKNLHLNFGINLTFGRKDAEKKVVEEEY